MNSNDDRTEILSNDWRHRKRSRKPGAHPKLLFVLIPIAILLFTGFVITATALVMQDSDTAPIADGQQAKDENAAPEAPSSVESNNDRDEESLSAQEEPNPEPEGDEPDTDYQTDRRPETESSPREYRDPGPTEKELLDLAMEDDTPAWETIESGRLYMRWAEDDEFDCGYYDCAVLYFYTPEQCNSGVYVEASIVVDDMVIDWTNDRTGGFGPDQIASATLEDHHNYEGDIFFELSDAHCTDW